MGKKDITSVLIWLKVMADYDRQCERMVGKLFVHKNWMVCVCFVNIGGRIICAKNGWFVYDCAHLVGILFVPKVDGLCMVVNILWAYYCA